LALTPNDRGAARGTNPLALGLSSTAPAQPAEDTTPATATFEFHNRVPGYQTSFYVLGFVTNTSRFAIDHPKVTVVLLDHAGKETATYDGYAEGDVIAPGAKAPVKVLVTTPPAFEKMSFEVVPKRATWSPQEAPGLRMELADPPHPTSGLSWEGSGKVHNDGAKGAKFVSVRVLAYDAKDHLVGIDSTFTDGEALGAKQSARFRALLLYSIPPKRFEYAVSGRPVD
ncbi:MAG TPA: FxLYD domain-containing protein, partial [Polyangiaceae bacterium]|jgi:hypothetical protein